MKYTVNLDPKELYNLADELDEYAKKFEVKINQFLLRLADLGISVAKANGGIFGGYIVYSKDFEEKGEIKTVKMMASDSTSITNTWYPSSKSIELREETISPLLMAEFGSGQYAINFEDLGGRGTLNKYGHASSNGWGWWTDDPSGRDGDIKQVKNGRFLMTSGGTPPSQPLHKAVMACIQQVDGIAREVFG